jgi:GTP-binding protein EngB required for normal cell division
MSYHNNIHIAILGPVSAGKSTYLNALFSDTFSDMKRKKTTMLPQIYQTTTNKAIINTTEEIYKMNHDSNEHILKLREENKYTQADFKELTYNVLPIPDFIKLPDKTATYSILDMPGLNCGGGDNMYFNYIQQISKDIDIYILVFDINSGLNTTDEINILQMIAKEIEKNKHGYVHIIINKCDDVEYDNDGVSFKFTDDELQELYDRCVETANKYMTDSRGKISMSPLCSSDLYVFRGIKNNINSIDEKHLDKIIMNECGKRELTKLDTIELKRKYILGLIKEKQSTMYNDWMKDTGYHLFQTNLNDMLRTSNYIKIVEHHILIKLLDILAKPITDFDDISNKMIELNNSIQQLSSVVKKYVIPDNITTIIKSITMKMNDYLDNGIDSYSASTVEIADTFINKISSLFGKIKSLFNGSSNPFEGSEDKLRSKRISLLNLELAKKYNESIFKELVDRKMLALDKFKLSIENTMKVSSENPYVTTIMIDLIDSISRISDSFEYIETIIEQFNVLPLSNMFIDDNIDYYEGLDKPTYHDLFLEFLKKVASIITDDTKKMNIILSLIHKYIKPTSTDKKGAVEQSKSYYDRQLIIYNEWINTNTMIINKDSKVGYLYYKIKGYLHEFNVPVNYFMQHTLSYEGFVNINKRMNMLYKTLKDIFNDVPHHMSIPITTSLQTVKMIITKDTPDTFIDAEDHNDSSEDYGEEDDANTVYKKATHNAKVRMNKTLKKADS